MKKLSCGAAAFLIASAFAVAAPVVEKPLFGAEEKVPVSTGAPVKAMKQQPPKTQGAAGAAANTDAAKNKAQGGKKKDTRIEDDPIGTRR